jgi:hypothetical protein
LIIVAAGSLLLGLLLSECKDNVITGDSGSPSNIVFPTDSTVSYSRHVQPLFNQTCALSSCHDDGQHQSVLKLTDYGNTVTSLPGVVVPRQPDQSTIILRIQGLSGARMPLNRNPLNQNQINGMRAWIAAGAKNN